MNSVENEVFAEVVDLTRENLRLREQVRVLREALHLWMALDKTFGVAKISTLHSIIADGDDSAPVADAVLKTRAALEATK